VRESAGISVKEASEWSESNNIPLAMMGWLSGTVLIWAALFTVGNFLYGRMGYAWSLLALSLATGTILVRVIKRLWV
jgi:hypothetical protein